MQRFIIRVVYAIRYFVLLLSKNLSGIHPFNAVTVQGTFPRKYDIPFGNTRRHITFSVTLGLGLSGFFFTER